MKTLQSVKEKAKNCRKIIGISKDNLLGRVQQYLWDKHKVELRPVKASSIRNSKAEVHPSQNCLLYDKNLQKEPEKLIFYIIHELGHLEIHPRLTNISCQSDPIYNEIYGCAGTNSLARYNPRSLEEVEANTFAAEFLCPSDEAFRLWRSSPGITLKEIAEQFGSPLFIVRSQLANALYILAFGTNTEKEPTNNEFVFNQSQTDASEKIGVPVLVDAGPGTGKTATLVRRIEFLLAEKQVEPSSILVLTFSNEACNELYERVAAKFDETIASKIRIATFHGFGLSLIQFHGQFKDLDANTRVLDEAGQRELVNEVLGELHNLKILKVSKPEETVKEIIRHIAFLKERMITPEILEQTINQISDEDINRKEKTQDLLRVFKDYEELKDSRDKLDFADLIQKSIEIFDSKAEVLEINQEKYKWVLVDEYQDVSRATAILLQRLCGEDNPPWVVGDKRQSIFRFCGANPENIDKFEEDFPNAERFTLNVNYRSSEPLVENKNKFAALMNPENNGEEIWEADSTNPKSEIKPAISFAVADSDEAERVGIVDQIQTWINQGVEIKDIAVLARRNVDVRNIVLALSKNNIPAVASGVVTAEGAAGDLANIITFDDYPIPSIPRLVYCLGRNDYKNEDLDSLIKQLLENFADNKEFQADDKTPIPELFDEIVEIHKCLTNEKFRSDAFSMICVFLFETGSYLRRLLNSTDEIEKLLALDEIVTTLAQSLALNEIVTTLTQAATYRFSHQDVKPDAARKDFAKFFRESLSQSITPTTSPPSNLNADAVKVMTCHASKGLEFPFVIVAGQTLSEIGKRGEYKWLPQTLCPNKEDDLEQSDSTLFVGVTRAKQGLTISYAKTATGLPRSRQRKIITLLQNWSEENEVGISEWNDFEITEKESFDTDKIWGGNLKYPISSTKLDKGKCSIATYLQDGLRLKYPLAEKPFYPTFYVVARQALNSIVERTSEKQSQISHQEAIEILNEHWNSEDFGINQDHIHHKLYFNLAQTFVKNFVDVYVPENGKINFIDLVIGKETERKIRLDLVCAYTINGNSPKAIFFRPESLKETLNNKGLLLWGKIKSYYRNAFVLLRKEFPKLEIMVFSGEDGILYDFNWSQERYIESQAESIVAKQNELSDEKFIGTVIENTCNYRCDNRINCPYWIGALKEEI